MDYKSRRQDFIRMCVLRRARLVDTGVNADKMCFYTVYVHGCGHFATGPILTHLCYYECDMFIDVETLRRDLYSPFSVRESMTVKYIDVDSSCLDCPPRTDPYEDIEVLDAEQLVWHVPHIYCNEGLFRPINFGTADKNSHQSESQVSQRDDTKVRGPLDEGSDSGDQESLSTGVALSTHTKMPPWIGSSLAPELVRSPASVTASNRRPAPSYERYRPYTKTKPKPTSPKISSKYLVSLPSPPAGLSLVESRRLDKLHHHISRELNHVVEENRIYPASTHMTFDQPFWSAFPGPSPYHAYPYEHAELRPEPLFLNDRTLHAQEIDLKTPYHAFPIEHANLRPEPLFFNNRTQHAQDMCLPTPYHIHPLEHMNLRPEPLFINNNRIHQHMAQEDEIIPSIEFDDPMEMYEQFAQSGNVSDLNRLMNAERITGEHFYIPAFDQELYSKENDMDDSDSDIDMGMDVDMDIDSDTDSIDRP